MPLAARTPKPVGPAHTAQDLPAAPLGREGAIELVQVVGDTLVESDVSSSSTFRARNWLNVVNSDPGNPGALTGGNFDTGIANIGLFQGGPTVIYTASPTARASTWA